MPVDTQSGVLLAPVVCDDEEHEEPQLMVVRTYPAASMYVPQENSGIKYRLHTEVIYYDPNLNCCHEKMQVNK